MARTSDAVVLRLFNDVAWVHLVVADRVGAAMLVTTSTILARDIGRTSRQQGVIGRH